MPSDSKHKATNNPDGLTPITSLYTNTPLTKNLTSAICSLSVLSGKITWHPMVSLTFTSCSSDKSKLFSVNFDIHRFQHFMLIKYLQPFCVKDLSKKKVLLYYRLDFLRSAWLNLIVVLSQWIAWHYFLFDSMTLLPVVIERLKVNMNIIWSTHLDQREHDLYEDREQCSVAMWPCTPPVSLWGRRLSTPPPRGKSCGRSPVRWLQSRTFLKNRQGIVTIQLKKEVIICISSHFCMHATY